MGSIITFGINIWFIRNGQAESYGVYVFWYSVAWVLSTCQSTLTVVHLSSLPSGDDRMAERHEPERVLFTVTLVLLTLAGFGVLAVNGLMAAAGSELTEHLAALFIPAFLLYQFVRAFAFSRRRTDLAAGLTGAVMVTAFAGLACDAWLGQHPSAPRVLLIVGVAYGLCSVLVLRMIDPSLRPVIQPAALRRYISYLRGSGWLVLGAGSAEVTSRLYSFLVVGWFGTEALARLSAVQVVVRPAWMLSSAWMSIGFPSMATQRAAGDRRGLTHSILRGAVLTAAGSACWTGIVLFAWPLVSAALYRGRYQDIGPLVWFWGGNVVLGSIAVPLNTAMLVLSDFRRLALIDLAGAVICSTALLLLLSRFNYPASILGTMAGQVTQIVLMAVALSRRLGTDLKLGAVRTS
jgi:O-antigen/teichoic acid export membrane protein